MEASSDDPIVSAVVEHARRHEVFESIPGVNAIVFGQPVPGLEFSIPVPAQVPDPSGSERTIDIFTGSIENGYVELLGLDLLHGRSPESFEPGVALVNQALAQAVWGRDNVVGERLSGSPRWSSEGVEIVGVLRNLSFGHPMATAKPFVFMPSGSSIMIVDSSLTLADLQQEFDRVISTGVVDAQISFIEPLARLRNELTAPDRARSLLTIVTSALVVLIAAFGFYGTQTYLVAAGRVEYAIRAALGAGPRALGQLVLWRALVIGMPGLILGAPLAFAAVAWLRGNYVSREVAPIGATIAIFAGLLVLLLLASYGPARQACRTQPAPLLRQD